jgi:hypothetical protein
MSIRDKGGYAVQQNADSLPLNTPPAAQSAARTRQAIHNGDERAGTISPA